MMFCGPDTAALRDPSMLDPLPAPRSAGLRLLLSRLDPDEERAGDAYERIRRALIRFFDWRGASFPEECADETLDRLVKKLEQGVAVIDVEGFALGIARLVLQEAFRADARRTSLEAEAQAALHADSAERQRMARYLDSCLENLPGGGRDLVLRYYAAGSRRAKIQSRDRLARELRLSDNALRSRVQRLRDRLEDCVRLKAAGGDRA